MAIGNNHFKFKFYNDFRKHKFGKSTCSSVKLDSKTKNWNNLLHI